MEDLIKSISFVELNNVNKGIYIIDDIDINTIDTIDTKLLYDKVLIIKNKIVYIHCFDGHDICYITFIELGGECGNKTDEEELDYKIKIKAIAIFNNYIKYR